jgi:hypothetical protein
LKKGLSREESKVKILQEWNGKRIDIEPLVHEFRIWLTQQEINLSRDKTKKSSIRIQQYQYSSNKKNESRKVSRIDWIEKLLQTPIEDYRKDCLWRIIGPYLLNVKNLSELEAAKVMEEWLDKCSGVRRLDFEPKTKIYSIIKGNKDFKPISYLKLKEEYNQIYLLLQNNNLSKNA